MYDSLLAANVYVAYRSKKLDKTTEKIVLKKLQENKINVKKLEKMSFKHCQEGESSTEEACSA
jgi:hypothetical protein